MWIKAASFAVFLLSGNCLAATTAVPLKHVSLDDFMPGGLRVSIPLQLSVPEQYELATLKNAGVDTFYWMPKSEVAHADETGDLPGETGFMHAEISINVGYRAEKDLFVGAEDLNDKDRAERDALFSDVRTERCFVGRFPVLLLDMKAKDGGRHLRAMYVATLIDTNAVYIDYLAPREHDDVGTYVWNDMKRSLVCRGPGNGDAHRAMPPPQT